MSSSGSETFAGRRHAGIETWRFREHFYYFATQADDESALASLACASSG